MGGDSRPLAEGWDIETGSATADVEKLVAFNSAKDV